MKIVFLTSNFRTNGNTARITALFEKELAAVAAREGVPLKLVRIQLGHLDIRACRGCRVCFDRGEEKCPQQDDLLATWDKIRQADGVFAASPVYVEDVNGIMKTWIDRMAFNCHRPAFAGKSAFILTTSGSGASRHARKTIGAALSTWGIVIAGERNFRMGALMDSAEIEAKYGGAIRKAAAKFFREVRENEVPDPSFYSLIAFKVQQKFWLKNEKYCDTVDFRYWQENGWLRKGCRYYVPSRANLLKVALARGVGSLAAMFFV